jgi:hypothetical protein
MRHTAVAVAAATRAADPYDLVGSGARPLPPTIRSVAMLLLNEELARARTREREKEAAEARLVRSVLAARRRQRRVAQAARRARLDSAAV